MAEQGVGARHLRKEDDRLMRGRGGLLTAQCKFVLLFAAESILIGACFRERPH